MREIEYKPGDLVVCLNQRSCHFGHTGTVIEPQEQHHKLSSIAGAPIVAVVQWDKFFPAQQIDEITTFTNPENLAPERAQDIIAARIYQILKNPNLGYVDRDLLREAAEKGFDAVRKRKEQAA
jgi:hypothetical protein